MGKTYFEKFLDKPFWFRSIIYFVFINILWIVIDWSDTGSLNLVIVFTDKVILLVLVGFALLLAFCQKSIYNSIFGRLRRK